MELSRKQLESLYFYMEDVAENARNHEASAKRSIVGTNRIIVVFTVIGFILGLLIMSDFILLNRAISHSIDSMSKINHQVVELRNTIDDITDSIESMGNSVEYLQRIRGSVVKITRETDRINVNMMKVRDQTMILGSDARLIGAHTAVIDKNFYRVNQSLGSISYSVNQGVKPIKQFVPLP